MKEIIKEENILAIETYLVWKDQRIAAKDFLKEAIKELEDYKSRIDKAIEFLKANADYTGIDFVSDLRYDECLDLLKILKGEENDKN